MKMKSKDKKRLYFRSDILWPMMWNYVISIWRALCEPLSPVICVSVDDVWLGKGEVMKELIVDPFRCLECWGVDQAWS